MSADYKTRDPFFDERDPVCNHGGGPDDIAAETWTRLRIAAAVDARLPSVLIWIANGMSQAEVAERLGVDPSRVSQLITTLRKTSVTTSR